MAVPKRKTSKARRNKRRTHWKLNGPTLARCSHCHQLKPSHSVCPNCGHYGGREVVKIEEEH
jgi:large subunit ribosomal protein L32